MAPPPHRRLRTGLFYALRTAFRIAPMPEATRDRLRQRFLDRYSNLIPPSPKGQFSEGTRVRRPYVRSDERAIGYVPYAKGELPDPLPATLIAFYLPQFHTIPENDEWWGKGFTEWRNVTRALPQFEGHYQPKLPGDLGFYDLRNPEVMREQARLAREYGISAFCFYFYWFGGKTLLETPLRNWLADPTIDLKFCLCWANEKWTRTWDGRGNETLIDQKHSPEDDLAFIAHIAEYMRDPRYLRVGGKPMLLVYRPGLFPDMAATAARWRKWCAENGIGEIHLAYVQSFERPDPRAIGFDAAVEFPPNLTTPLPITSGKQLINPHFSGEVLDWRTMAAEIGRRANNEYLTYSAVNPGWDNEARRPSKGRVFQHSSPGLYQDWLAQSIANQLDEGATPPLIFINAWNEWAEGATLEPTAALGYANLQATRQALGKSLASSTTPSALRYCATIHVWYFEALDEILSFLGQSGLNWYIVVTTSADLESDVRTKIASYGFSSHVVLVDNRGRDILPFLQLCSQLYNEGVDVVLKLHTKRSLHRNDGDLWRRELLEQLLGENRANTIISAFQQNSTLGLVAAEGHILPLTSFWGASKEVVESVVDQLGLNAPSSESVFASGSMFWIRLDAIRTLFDGHLYEHDFEEETGQIDGTLSHALERMFCIVVESRDFSVESAAAVCQTLERKVSDYPFARRTLT